MTTTVSKGVGLPALNATFKAYDTGLATAQFCLVKLTSQGIVDVAAAATDAVVGVVDNVPYAAVGSDVTVIMLGEAKVKIGGAVAVGNRLAADASGYGVALTPGNTTVNYSVGFALEDGETNDIIRICVLPQVVLV